MPKTKRGKTLQLIAGLRLAAKIKKGYVRLKSAQDYKNHVDRFERYAQKEGFADLPLTQFTRRDALLYFDDSISSRDINAVTRNNYMRCFRSLFYSLVEWESYY